MVSEKHVRVRAIRPECPAKEMKQPVHSNCGMNMQSEKAIRDVNCANNLQESPYIPPLPSALWFAAYTPKPFVLGLYSMNGVPSVVSSWKSYSALDIQ